MMQSRMRTLSPGIPVPIINHSNDGLHNARPALHCNGALNSSTLPSCPEETSMTEQKDLHDSEAKEIMLEESLPPPIAFPISASLPEVVSKGYNESPIVAYNSFQQHIDLGASGNADFSDNKPHRVYHNCGKGSFERLHQSNSHDVHAGISAMAASVPSSRSNGLVPYDPNLMCPSCRMLEESLPPPVAFPISASLPEVVSKGYNESPIVAYNSIQQHIDLGASGNADFSDNKPHGVYQHCGKGSFEGLHQSNSHDAHAGISAMAASVPSSRSNGLLPYDPNLMCPSCRTCFRIGEIQMYRYHASSCASGDKSIA